MTTRRRILGLLAVAPVLIGNGAIAAETADTPAASETAQKAGNPILAHNTAPWCKTCTAQKPVLANLEDDPEFKRLQVFDVDVDSPKDVVEQFGATMQSTLITYKGTKETGRSMGETRPEAIWSLLRRAF